MFFLSFYIFGLCLCIQYVDQSFLIAWTQTRNPQFWAEQMLCSILMFGPSSWGQGHALCAPRCFPVSAADCCLHCTFLNTAQVKGDPFSPKEILAPSLPHCLSALAQAREDLSPDDQLLRNPRGAKMIASDTGGHGRRVLIIHNYKHFHVHAFHLLGLILWHSDSIHCGNL